MEDTVQYTTHSGKNILKILMFSDCIQRRNDLVCTIYTGFKNSGIAANPLNVTNPS